MRPPNTKVRGAGRTRRWRNTGDRPRFPDFAASVRVKKSRPLLPLRSVARESPPCRSK